MFIINNIILLIKQFSEYDSSTVVYGLPFKDKYNKRDILFSGKYCFLTDKPVEEIREGWNKFLIDKPAGWSKTSLL